jgi:hypothetical protein
MKRPKNYTSRDQYRFYRRGGGKLLYKKFIAVLDLFNKLAMDAIIYEGKSLNMGHRLSYLSVSKSNTYSGRKRVNWNESNKYKAEIIARGDIPKSKETPDGQEWLVYYTDEIFVRFHWRKTFCRVPHKSAYSFHPTRGKKGNKTKLTALLIRIPSAHTRYDLLRVQ